MRLLLWACAYLAIAAVLLGANPLRGQTVGPFDLLAAHPGWKVDDAPVTVRNPERSDILDALVPEWMEARRQVRAGELPLWNPLRAGGGAALFDPTNALLTPGFAAFAAAPYPAFGFYLSVLLTLAIAGLGMHLLVARECGPWASLFAGISYMACGFLTAWLYWPHAHTAIWIPWLLLAVGGFAGTGSLRTFAGIAATTALMFLGGFPFVIAIGFGAALVHAVICVARLDRKPMTLRFAGVLAAMAVGLALAAIPLLTMLSDFSALDLGYRDNTGRSGMTLEVHRKLLLLPWAREAPRVESNMYVGMAVMVLMVVGIASLFRRHRKALAISGVAFLLVGGMLVFGILPLDIGRRLPVLSNNPWSRAIVLLDIGLILLAAVGFDRLVDRIRWRPATLVVASLLCMIQFYDLGRQFRRFNGAVPAKYFYPVSAELAHLKQVAKPFQYVGQDSSYFIQSGTLGAIGLGEWFAHSLRTPQMRNFLDAMAEHPFTTATATAIIVSDFHWSDDLTDAAGLCYAAFPTETGGRQLIAHSPRGRKQAALPPINNIDLVQPIRVQEPARPTGIAVKLATYRATDLDGEVTLTLRRPGGGDVARSTLPAARVQDNRMAHFPFTGAPVLHGDYEAVIRYTPGSNRRNMTAWLQTDVRGQLVHGGRTIPGMLQFALFGPVDSALQVIARGDAVTVARNVDCVDGAYWTADLTAPLSDREAGSIRLARYRPHDFSLVSVAGSPGFVVVPMQYQTGWTAHVDGRPARVHLVKGVMPAVAVPAGRAEVTFAYRPPRWRLGLAISCGAMLLLAGIWGIRRKRRQGVGYPGDTG